MKVLIDDITFYYTEHQKIGDAIPDRSLSYVEVDYIIQINNSNELRGTKKFTPLEYEEKWSFKNIKEKIKQEVIV